MSKVSDEMLEVAEALEEFAMIDECEGGNPLVIATERRAAELLRSASTPAKAVKVALPDNLESHRHSWLKAFDRLIELEPESTEPDMDEKGYWRHERQAMLDMYADLDRILSALEDAPQQEPVAWAIKGPDAYYSVTSDEERADIWRNEFGAQITPLYALSHPSTPATGSEHE